jgi:hypothetical protein
MNFEISRLISNGFFEFDYSMRAHTSISNATAALGHAMHMPAPAPFRNRQVVNTPAQRVATGLRITLPAGSRQDSDTGQPLRQDALGTQIAEAEQDQEEEEVVEEEDEDEDEQAEEQEEGQPPSEEHAADTLPRAMANSPPSSAPAPDSHAPQLSLLSQAPHSALVPELDVNDGHGAGHTAEVFLVRVPMAVDFDWLGARTPGTAILLCTRYLGAIGGVQLALTICIIVMTTKADELVTAGAPYGWLQVLVCQGIACQSDSAGS